MESLIISLRGAHKTSIMPPLLIETAVPIQESERSCICVLGVSIRKVSGHVFVCWGESERSCIYVLERAVMYLCVRVKVSGHVYVC